MVLDRALRFRELVRPLLEHLDICSVDLVVDPTPRDIVLCVLPCRYPMYIESKAWVTNLKQKLACGSILISNKMEYFEFFTRALKPGIHYVEVDQNNLCLDTAEKVQIFTIVVIPIRSSWGLGLYCLRRGCRNLKTVCLSVHRKIENKD